LVVVGYKPMNVSNVPKLTFKLDLNKDFSR
jgi:hypothetical protein